MKLLKYIAVLLGIIVLAALVTALFVRKTYHVERKIVINKPEDTVFDYIRLLKNQNNYSKWASMDPDMEKKYKGVDGMAGFVSSWSSAEKQVGKGEQTIIQIIENERVDYDLHFIEPFETKASAYMTTDMMTDSATLVTWGFNGQMKYPSNLMLLFMNMEKMIGNDLSEGLGNLKRILEGV